jgi:hypothetical protein
MPPDPFQLRVPEVVLDDQHHRLLERQVPFVPPKPSDLHAQSKATS